MRPKVSFWITQAKGNEVSLGAVFAYFLLRQRESKSPFLLLFWRDKKEAPLRALYTLGIFLIKRYRKTPELLNWLYPLALDGQLSCGLDLCSAISQK